MTFKTKPEPFERIPLIYERAFGGWDRSHPETEKHGFEPRNPVGTGFRAKRGKFEKGIRLPNLEDPQRPLKGHRDKPPPTGFGFISPHWPPRAALAELTTRRGRNKGCRYSPQILTGSFSMLLLRTR